MLEDKQNIAMFGQKHMLSREGGVEIVVKELATRMAAKGNNVICFDRKSRHVSGSDLDLRREFNGVSIIPVWTVGKKGWAAVTSSFSAALKICRNIWISTKHPYVPSLTLCCLHWKTISLP